MRRVPFHSMLRMRWQIKKCKDAKSKIYTTFHIIRYCQKMQMTLTRELKRNTFRLVCQQGRINLNLFAMPIKKKNTECPTIIHRYRDIVQVLCISNTYVYHGSWVSYKRRAAMSPSLPFLFSLRSLCLNVIKQLWDDNSLYDDQNSLREFWCEDRQSFSQGSFRKKVNEIYFNI